MKITFCPRLVLILGIAAAFATITAAQDGVQTRSITSDDFASQRAGNRDSPGTKKVKTKPKRFTYKFVRSEKNAAKGKTGRKAPVKPGAADPPAKITEIGVTIWKMRPPRPAEKRLFLLPVLDDRSERQMWLAERVVGDTVFRAGDKVRFAIESSDSGYLYVIGRESYSDGSFGAPYGVFPASSDDNNLVRPGMLFDFPDQKDDLPYLKISPKKPNYAGELLTVVIAPKPLTSIRVDQDGKLKNAEDLIDLEFGADVEIFSRLDTSDRIYSKTESESACGVKTRELVREGATKGDPCGSSSRPLTPSEPLPQSIYRVRGAAGHPAVAFVKLVVRQ